MLQSNSPGALVRRRPMVASFRSTRRFAFVFPALGALLGGGGESRAVIYNWNHDGVSFFDVGPWSPAGTPGAADTVNFHSFGDGSLDVTWDAFTQTTIPTVSAMNISAPQVTHRSNLPGTSPFLLTVTNGVNVSGGSYLLGAVDGSNVFRHNLTAGGMNIGAGGTTTVAQGSTLNVGASIDIGVGSNGTLNVNGTGATVVAGATSTIELDWGRVATANVTFQNGASGDINSTVNIAKIGGTATVNVQSAATVEFDNIELGSVLPSSTTSALFNVTGTSSTVTQSGASTFNVGSNAASSGTSTLNINSGGRFTTGTGATNVQKSGTVQIGGGTFNTRGALTIDGLVDLNSGELYADDNIIVRNSGVLRLDGGTFSQEGDKSIALNSNAQLVVAGDLLRAFTSLQITGGADANLSGALFMPVNTSLLVSGNGSSLTTTGAASSTWGGGGNVSVTLEQKATGTIAGAILSETNGGITVQSDADLQTGSLIFRSIGPGTTNTLTVTGAGSTWTQGSGAVFGFGQIEILYGDCVFNVLDGGTFTTGAGQNYLGQNATVNITGGNLLLHGDTNIDGDINLNSGLFSTTSLSFFVSTSPQFNFTGGTFRDINDLSMNATDNLHNARSLTSGKTLDVDGVLTMDGVQLTLDGGALEVGGISSSAGGSLVWYRGNVNLTGGTGNANLMVPPLGQLTGNGTAAGTVTALAGSTITATGNLALGKSTAVNGFASAGTLNVGQHTVTLNDSNDAVFDSLALVNIGNGSTPGTLAAPNGLTLDFGGNIVGVGAINTPNTIAKPLINNGHIAGNSPTQRITLSGYVKGVGTLDNVTITGTDAPGFSPAAVVRGSVAYNGTLQIEMAGTTPGSGHDQIQHVLGAGAASLGGTLNLDLISGFSPSGTDTFEFLTYASRTGRFSTVTGDGAGWAVHYGADAATAIVDEWQSPAQLAGEFVVPFDAEVTGDWLWSGLLVKRGDGDLVLNLDGSFVTSAASLAIVSGSVRLEGDGTRALALEGFTFGELGFLTGDPSLAGVYGFYAAVSNVPEPAASAIGLLAMGFTALTRRRK